MNNKCPTMPEVTSTLHSPQLSQPTPSLGKWLSQLGGWDGWEKAMKNRQGGDRAVFKESEDVWENSVANCSRLLCFQILSLKASTKSCRLISSARNSLENVSPILLKTIIAVNKSYFFGRPCLCSVIIITTHTHKQTDSQQFALCSQNRARWQKENVYTFQETAERQMQEMKTP